MLELLEALHRSAEEYTESLEQTWPEARHQPEHRCDLFPSSTPRHYQASVSQCHADVCSLMVGKRSGSEQCAVRSLSAILFLVPLASLVARTGPTVANYGLPGGPLHFYLLPSFSWLSLSFLEFFYRFVHSRLSFTLVLSLCMCTDRTFSPFFYLAFPFPDIPYLVASPRPVQPARVNVDGQ